jgi:hypothetical protein
VSRVLLVFDAPRFSLSHFLAFSLSRFPRNRHQDRLERRAGDAATRCGRLTATMPSLPWSAPTKDTHERHRRLALARRLLSLQFAKQIGHRRAKPFGEPLNHAEARHPSSSFEHAHVRRMKLRRMGEGFLRKPLRQASFPHEQAKSMLKSHRSESTRWAALLPETAVLGRLLFSEGLSMRCDGCRCRIRLPEGVKPGRRISCPKCGQKLTVPPKEDVEAIAADVLCQDMQKPARPSWAVHKDLPEQEPDPVTVVSEPRPSPTIPRRESGWPTAAWLFALIPIVCLAGISLIPARHPVASPPPEPVSAPAPTPIVAAPVPQQEEAERFFVDAIASLDAGQIIRARVLVERYLASKDPNRIDDASRLLKEISRLDDREKSEKVVGGLSQADLEALGRAIGPDTLGGAAGAELRTMKNQRLKEQLFVEMRGMVANEMRRRDNVRELKKIEQMAAFQKEVAVQDAKNASARELAAKQKALLEAIEIDRLNRRREASMLAERRLKEYALQVPFDSAFEVTLALNCLDQIYKSYRDTGKPIQNVPYTPSVLREIPVIVSIGGDWIPGHDPNGISVRQAWAAYLDQH